VATTEHASESGRAFLQQRLALFARTLCLLFGVVLLLGQTTLAFYPEMRSSRYHLDSLSAGVGVVALGAVWLVARRPRALPAWMLLGADAALLIGSGLFLGASAAASRGESAQLLLPFIMQLLMMFGRVVFVPSTTARTLWLSTAAMAPITLAQNVAAWRFPQAAMLPPFAFFSGSVAVAGAAVALAAVGSQVIYGLRAEVREAKQLGQYTLLEKIGEGGMGAVYKARHAMMRRPTAIKLLPQEGLDEEALERFEREVQLTSELTHPNTIAIYDYGRSADGVFYYAMEYLDGVDLETLVEQYGALSAPRVVHILKQVAGALAEAHARGLIHRDIKPANLILCRRGNKPDFLKVVDFGLVKRLDEPGEITGKNLITGTPGYLAPETMTTPDAVGAAADLYALGAVAYFLLTGTQVFRGATLAELCAQHIITVPEPLSARCAEPVEPALEALILRCLEKKPADRPASAEELSRELAALDVAPWDEAEAEAWWAAHADGRRIAALESAPTVALAVDLAAR
jgi:tRNA A-37 threonylcarbamoyl transferase component Bud32